MRGNWSTPFEPWVIESWRQWSEKIGAKERADIIRNNLTYAAKISNDPKLTTEQKIDLIRKGPPVA